MISVVAIVVFLFFLVIKFRSKKKKFPKKSFSIAFFGFICVILFYYFHFYTFILLPTGYLNQVVLSPDKQHEIRTYHYKSLYNRTSRAELIEIPSGKKQTIYFNDYDYSPFVEWIDNNSVKIGRETLDISKKEVYNFRLKKNIINSLPPQA